MYVRLFEEEGITLYKVAEDGKLREVQPRSPYRQTVVKDAMGEEVIAGENYGVLPIVALYANPEHRSELDNST